MQIIYFFMKTYFSYVPKYFVWLADFQVELGMLP